MDLQLTYKDSKEHGWPDHRSKIIYYLVEENFYISQTLHPQYYEITYEWYSKCQEVQEYYDPITQGNYNLGDCKPSQYFADDENESHRTVYLGVNFNGYHFKIKDNEDLPRIAWAYTHDIQREISKYQGKDYFPCFDINNLLRGGIVVPVDFEKHLVGQEGNQYYHVYGHFVYKDNVYSLKLSQDAPWQEGDWEVDGQYGKVDVFEWRKL